MVIKDVLKVLDHFGPFDTQLEFDNSGLLIGNENTCVDKIAIALDATKFVIEQAIALNCDLLVTHHPIIFDPLKNIDTSSVVSMCIKNGLNVISVHTNFDRAQGGVNDLLADKLKLENVQNLEDFARMGNKHFDNAEQLALFLKQQLNCNVKFVGANKPIEKIALCGGSGAFCIDAAIKSGCDALVTGEAKHNNRIDALNNGFALFECGHYNTEKFIKEKIEQLLTSNGFESHIINEDDCAQYL